MPLAPALLLPTGDPKPVEKAVVDSILDQFEPETFLWINLHRPDGGVHVWYAWTAGGTALGDTVDLAALTSGSDAADWLHLTGRHRTDHFRGRIHTQAHPLRPIQADLARGDRAPENERDKLSRLLCSAAELAHQSRPLDRPLPRWVGVGPTLLNRPTPATR
ncbi:hypothetical protein [Kitasatospora cineracea]|uniref:Uncharacterized protein n=1 Tax=Kitasatospora cineracea TaxID=88074 RepID=A0A3N4RFT6_9ACTN|nr:hypothetical protein [Kitasatospora cineracea]RPE27257.1 hypothetical protein EDD38_7402 [Kitasatospora cineracea]